jgi:hypothetical protein
MTQDSKRQNLSSHKEAMNMLLDCVNKGMKDSDIQESLFKTFGYKWTLDAIRKNRRKIGIVKDSSFVHKDTPNETPILTVPPPGLDELSKAKWFRAQFKKSHLFPTLLQQFDKEEVESYLEEYGSICCQFEDIIFSEFFQIDDFLKHRILINRQLIFMKDLQKEITEISNWIEINPLKDGEPKESTMARVGKMRNLDSRRVDLHKANERYDKLVSERQKIASNLAATRRDRLDELKNSKESFFNLLSVLQSSAKERDKQGRYAEMTKIAADDVKKEFRKIHDFPDGSKDALLMDGDDEGDIDYE